MNRRCFTCAVAVALLPLLNLVFADDLGPFGIGSCHINNRSMQDNARWIPQMQQIGLRYYRTPQTGWSAVEPEQGKWHWETLDAQLAYLQDQGFSSGGILIGNPGWNTRDEPGTMPVHNLPAWSLYVSSVVGHCRDSIKRWEVWNEPPNFTGKDQTPADYARIVVAAYRAAKAADPDCLVGLAAKSAHVNYLEQVIKAGAKDHFDFITLHPYEVLDGVASNVGTEPMFMHIVPTVRRMLKKQNPVKVDVPIIFTELGCDVSKGAAVQAHTLVKAYTMSIAQGVACVHWFEGRDGDSGPMGLLDGQGQPRPAYHALGNMIRHLGQHPDYVGWVSRTDGLVGFIFQGADTTVMVAWASGGRETAVQFADTVSAADPITGEVQQTDGITLTSAPVIVLDVPADLLRQAIANRRRMLLWGGDFSDSNIVSITMGDEQIARGLHTLSGDAVANAVTAYGGSARAGDVPGGNMFVVDPGFLSYNSEPIEITAEVRRNEANDNSGFKLVYESTNGFRTAGTWYTVPDNTRWHTVTWRIDDPQFVAYWGYNFSLVSDGNVYNKYYLRSVSVRKLSR